MSEEFTRDELHDLIDTLIEELLFNAGFEQPPVDVITLSKRLDHSAVIQRAMTTLQRKSGLANPETTNETVKQFAVALTLAEHYKPEILRRLGIDPTQRKGLMGESLSNSFATRLLVPTKWLRDQGTFHDWNILAMAQEFGTAPLEMVAYRIVDLPQPAIITLVDNDSVTRRKSNYCSPGKGLTPVEKKCQQHVHRYSRPQEISEDGWRVRGWPIHQEDWKREILWSVNEETEKEGEKGFW